MAKVPLYFEANVGQADPVVQVVSRGGGFLTLLTSREAYFVNTATKQPIVLRFTGGSDSAKVTLEEELPGVSHYFRGKDPSKWRTGVRHYARARFSNVYPGIDVLFYSSDNRLEYDFIVAPGADPSVIQIDWIGVETTGIDDSGDLIVTTSAGNLRQKRPLVYQDIGGKRRLVEARYRLDSQNSYALDLVSWERNAVLVIDPAIQYSTFIGGTVIEEAGALTVDARGSAIIGGYTQSTDFPVAEMPIVFRGSFTDAFVTMLNNQGNGLMFSAFLGGEGAESVTALTIDSDGQIYAAGYTGSYSMPTTPNAYQPLFSGIQDIFIAKFNPNGAQLVFLTYFGAGSSAETVSGIAVDALSNVTIAGTTTGSALVTTAGAYDRTGNGGDDGFVARIAANFRELQFSTFLGGSDADSINGMTLDAAGELYLVGTSRSPNFPTTEGAYQRTLSGPSDAFLCKMSQTGRRISFCTLFGGSSTEEGLAVALEAGGRAVVGGNSSSTNFPATAEAMRKVLGGVSDSFAARFNTNGSTVIAATLLGGSGEEFLSSAMSSTGGFMILAGTTSSLNFPFTSDAFQFSSTSAGDGFLTVLQPLGNAVNFSSVLGGSNIDQIKALARDRVGDLYIAGASNSADLITTPLAFDTTLNGSADVFVARAAGFGTQECVAFITATATSYSSLGGGGGVGVGAGCPWNAFSTAPWLSFAAGTPVLSQTAGSINYTVGQNNSPEPRTAAIYAAGNLIQVVQKGTSTTPPYGDVPSADIFADYIRIIKNSAITTGCGGSNYCPADTTTRGQMAVFLVRAMLGTDDFTVRQDPYFLDVNASHPLFKWIQKLRELNVTTGCTQFSYCPNDPVTRGQMAVFLVRAKFGDFFDYFRPQYFSDVPSTHLFFTYIQKLRQLGITAGCTAANYCPDSTNTRGQMAVFLTRMFFTPW